MTTSQALLGPVANVQPTPAAAAAIRKAVLAPRGQYPKTGMQSAPRCLDGYDPYLYALHAGIVTLDELRPWLVRWRDEELLNRGLGTGIPQAAAEWHDPYTGAMWLNAAGDPVPVTIHDCQHETIQQYLTNALLLSDDVSKQAVTDLVRVILADSTLDPAVKVENSRQLGRPMVALLQEGSDDALSGAAVLIGKVLAQMGSKDGVHFYTSNTKAGADHARLPWNTQQESTILKGLALAYGVWPSAPVRDAIYHGIAMLADAQRPDGSFANDMGPDDASDADSDPQVFDPGKTMDLWCVAALVEAKDALGGLWPSKAQKVLDAARQLWLATDYTRPSSKSFHFNNVLSITLACAAEWGWRE